MRVPVEHASSVLPVAQRSTQEACSTAILLLALLAFSQAQAADRPLLKKVPIDRAIEAGVEYLANTQVKDEGCWTGGKTGKNMAVTSLALMAMLSAGHVPGEGKHGK